MEPYELRKHLASVAVLLGEILAEVKEMRKDYAEGQAVVCCPDEPFPEIEFNTSYEG